MSKVLDSGIEMSKFELQAGYYDPFRTTNQANGLNPIAPPTGYILLLLFSTKKQKPFPMALTVNEA